MDRENRNEQKKQRETKKNEFNKIINIIHL